MIEFSYNNQFDLSDHSLSVNIFNALSHFLTESTIPFIKRTCDGKNSMTESTCTKDTDYAYLFGFCKYYPSFIKNINNIIQIINSKDYFKNTLLWFSYSIESELKLDKFLHYYRVIEVLSNNYHSEKIKKIQLFIDRELKEFPNLAPHNILSNKDRLSYFLKIKGVDEKTIKTIDELRNKRLRMEQMLHWK